MTKGVRGHPRFPMRPDPLPVMPAPISSCPDLFRASLSTASPGAAAWMPGTSPGMTAGYATLSQFRQKCVHAVGPRSGPQPQPARPAAGPGDGPRLSASLRPGRRSGARPHMRFNPNGSSVRPTRAGSRRAPWRRPSAAAGRCRRAPAARPWRYSARRAPRHRRRPCRHACRCCAPPRPRGHRRR